MSVSLSGSLSVCSFVCLVQVFLELDINLHYSYLNLHSLLSAVSQQSLSSLVFLVSVLLNILASLLTPLASGLDHRLLAALRLVAEASLSPPSM